MTLDTVLQVLLLIIIVELVLYLLNMYSRGFSSLVKSRNITISFFTVMVDVSRFNLSFRRSAVVSRVVGFVGMLNVVILILIFYWIALPSVLNIIKSLLGVSRVVEAPLVPVVPGVTIRGMTILYFLVGVGIGIIVHEFSHALVALNEGIKVNSWGLGIFLVFPFAYVRINDNDYNNASLSSKVKVLSAGVLSNTAIALLTLLLLNIASAGISQYSVVIIQELDRSLGPQAPAVVAGLPTPSVINDINGTRIRTLNDLRNYLSSIANISTTLVINISRIKGLEDDVIVSELYKPEVVVVNKPSNWSRLGILVVEGLSPETPKHLYYLGRVLYWTYLVNISLAVFNAAPLIVTDGGRIIYEFSRKYGLTKVNNVVQWATVVITAILLMTGFVNII